MSESGDVRSVATGVPETDGTGVPETDGTGVPETDGTGVPETDGTGSAVGNGGGSAEGSAGAGAPGGDEARLCLPPAATTALGVLLLAEVVAVCGALVSLWPVVLALVDPEAKPGATVPWSPFGLGEWALTADTAMLLAVILCSGLGSFVHAATSFATYVGNRRLYASWLWWYLLRSGIGVALALLVHLLLRGGLFAGNSGAGATNPYGFCGIAGLCGLFSKQAADKLREICDTILSTSGDGDSDRRDKLATRDGEPDPDVT
ncbi:hypothetical protein ACFV6E_41975 [Streptomyces sp. NPDC059785]|uniref:hypothetical protein n=1 Tax=unclassified Streptomyces TaxID=2593676 RepID=UPI00364CB601